MRNIDENEDYDDDGIGVGAPVVNAATSSNGSVFVIGGGFDDDEGVVAASSDATPRQDRASAALQAWVALTMRQVENERCAFMRA